MAGWQTADFIRLRLLAKRRADLDNFHKLSFDALTGIVWEDDSQVEELTVRREYDKGRPHVELTI